METTPFQTTSLLPVMKRMAKSHAV